MYRGTTPTININVTGCELSDIKNIEVVLKNDKQIIERNKENVDITDNMVSFTLTQEETLLLNTRYKLWLQIRILTSDDMVVASEAKCLDVKDILRDEVLE